MGELRQIPFEIDRSISVPGRLLVMRTVDHYARIQWTNDGAAIVMCSCKDKDGKDTRWKISAKRASDEEIMATFNSHLAYFQRAATKPD